MKPNRKLQLIPILFVMFSSSMLVPITLNINYRNSNIIEEKDSDIKSAPRERVKITLSGTIRNDLGNPLYKAKVTAFIPSLGRTKRLTTYTNINGYYRFSFWAEAVISVTVKAEKTGYTTKQETLNNIVVRVQSSVYISINIPVKRSHGNKIGVFFWASDSLYDDMIIRRDYTRILKKEGYSSFFYFKDTGNYEDNFDTVNSYEDDNDIIFIYIKAHGNYISSTGHSYSDLGSVNLHSYELKAELNNLDAKHIGFLVSSCFSGGFVNKFIGSGYLAISSADTKHSSYKHSDGEGYFADEFFDAVNDGDSVHDAYWEAKSSYKWYDSFPFKRRIRQMQNPLKYHGDSYNFFSPKPKPHPTPPPSEPPIPPPGGHIP